MDRINLSSCPALAVGNAPAWYGPANSPGRVTDLTGMDRATGFSSVAGQTITPRFPVTAGLIYATSVQVKPGYTGTVAMGIDWYSSTAYLSSSTGSADVVNGVVQRIGLVGVAPATAIEGLQALSHNGGPLQITAHLPEQAAAIGSYFDGATAATTTQSAGTWDGTAGASRSRVTLLPQLVDTVVAETVNSPSTATTASITPRQNEILVVKVAAGDEDVTIGAPTGGGLVWTLQLDETSQTNYAPTRLFTAVVGASPTAMTVSVPVSNTVANRYPSLVVERWAYAQLAATPAVNPTGAGSRYSSANGAPSSTITPTSANSALTWLVSDWTGSAATPITYRGTATQNYLRRVTGGIGVYSAWQRAGATTAQTFGLSSPSLKWTALAIELQPGPAPVENVPTTAAERYSWGTALGPSDDFAGTTLDGTKWSTYNGPGHAGNGTRTPTAVDVSDGTLKIYGRANGEQGGISHRFGRQYGRWEIRARTVVTGTTGDQYHAVLIIWPDSEQWPQDGEYDFFEITFGQSGLTGYMHYPHDVGTTQQEGYSSPGVDITQWHNYAIEWTSAGLKGYVDGVQWFTAAGGARSTPAPARRDVQTMPSGHLTMQVDMFSATGTAMRPAYMEVDSARLYSLDGTANTTAAPAGLGSGEQTGAQAVTRGAATVAPSGIGSGETLGAHTVPSPVAPQAIGMSGAVPGAATPGAAAPGAPASGIGSGEQPGGHEVKVDGQLVTIASGIATGEAGGAPTVLPGTATVAPAGVGPGEQPGAHTVLRGAVTVAPSGIVSGEQPGTAVVLRGTVTVGPPGVGSAEQTGTSTVLRGTVTVTANSVGSGELCGTPALLPGGVTVGPSGVASSEQPGVAVVLRGTVIVVPAGVGPGEQPGAHAVLRGGVTVTPSGIESGEALGVAVVLRGGVTVAPAAIGSSEACGSPRTVLYAVPAGIVSREQPGVAVVLRGGVRIDLGSSGSTSAVPGAAVPGQASPGSTADGAGGGVPTAAQTGVPVVQRGVVRIGAATGAATAEQLGVAAVLRGERVVALPGMVSAEQPGAHAVSRAGRVVAPSGVGGAEQSGVVVVARGARAVDVPGAVSGEQLGLMSLQGFAVINSAGLPSAGAIGAPAVDTGRVSVGLVGRIVSGEQLGVPAVVRGGRLVAADSIDGAGTLGVLVVARSGVRVSPAGVDGGAIGELTVTRGVREIAPAGISLVDTIHGPVVQPGPVRPAPAGIPPDGTTGTPVVLRLIGPQGVSDSRVGRPVVRHQVRRDVGALTATHRSADRLTASHRPT